MHRPSPRPLLLAVTVLAALCLVAGPASATGGDPAVIPLAAEDPGTGEEAPAEDTTVEEDEGAAEDGHKRPLPIDLTDPQGIFGAFLLLGMLAAAGLGLRNALVQLRGDRPQADGSWRWR